MMNIKHKLMQIYISFYISGLMDLSDFILSILFKIFCPDTTHIKKKIPFSAYVEFLILKRIRGAHTRRQAWRYDWSARDRKSRATDFPQSISIFKRRRTFLQPTTEGTISVAKFALGKTIVSAGNPGLCFLIWKNTGYAVDYIA